MEDLSTDEMFALQYRSESTKGKDNKSTKTFGKPSTQSYSAQIKALLETIHPDYKIDRESRKMFNRMLIHMLDGMIYKAMEIQEEVGKDEIDLNVMENAMIAKTTGQITKHAKSEGKKALMKVGYI